MAVQPGLVVELAPDLATPEVVPPEVELELEDEARFPSEDGEPMAESDYQLNVMVYSIAALKSYFQGRDDVYIAGNMLVYLDKDDPKQVLSPDMFVVFGTSTHYRMSYKLWEEGGKLPAFVLEISSIGTWRVDMGEKMARYERLGIQEYFQFDPTGRCLKQPFEARRLVNGKYEVVPVVTLEDGTAVVYSEVLGLELHARGENFRFVDPLTGEQIPSLIEAQEQVLREAKARRLAEEAAAQAAATAAQEAEARRLAEEAAAQAAATAAQEAEARRLAEEAAAQAAATAAQEAKARRLAEEAATQEAEARRLAEEAAAQEAEARRLAEATAQEAVAAASQEAEARRALEAEIARLRAEVARRTPPDEGASADA